MQPFAFVTVTEYVPPDVTVIHCEVAPVLHKYEVAVAAHNCDDCPLQKLDPVISHTGRSYLTTVLLQLLVHPFAFVTVTE